MSGLVGVGATFEERESQRKKVQNKFFCNVCKGESRRKNIHLRRTKVIVAIVAVVITCR